MSYPDRYTRQYDFQAYQTANPTRPLPGDKVNADLNAVVISIDEIVDFLEGFTRSDGALANGSVGVDQLTAGLQSALGSPSDNLAAEDVDYDPTTSGLSATDVQAAIDEIVAASGAISSVFGRTGAIVAVANDYAASEVENDSSVVGATVKAALETLAAGTFQPLDATLTALAGVATAANKVIYSTGSDTFTTADFTAYGRSVAAVADEAAFKALVNLEAGVDYQAYDADLTTWAGLTPSANAQSLVTAADYAAMRALLDLEAGTDFLSPAAIAAAYQPLDSGLTALAAFNTNGILVQTANNTFSGRSLAAPAAGFTITNPAGTAGDPTFVLANDLSALEALASTGLAARTASDTWAQRTITGTANEITLADGNGVSGNPTISLSTVAKYGRTGQWFEAADFRPELTNGAGRSYTSLATNLQILDALDFDTTTQEFANLYYKFPTRWNLGTITFIPHWTAQSSSGTVEWAVQAAVVSNDDPDNPSWGTEQTSADTLLATGDTHMGPESSAITAGGTPTAADGVWLRIKRNVANDTLAADAQLKGIEVFFTAAAGNDT